MAIDDGRRILPLFPRRPAPDLALPAWTARCRSAANLLRVGIKVANDKIRAAADADRARARMGATVVAMAVGETQVAIAHAGDSRAYRLRGGDLKRLTRDHSIAEEMRAARPEMTDDELAGFAHRNVVTRSLGQQGRARARRLREPGRTPATLHAVHRRSVGLGARRQDRRASSQSTGDLEAACQLLVDAANEAGGPDNITVLLVRRRLTVIRQALVRDKRILVCVGPGGVGKTTIAAARGRAGRAARAADAGVHDRSGAAARRRARDGRARRGAAGAVPGRAPRARDRRGRRRAARRAPRHRARRSRAWSTSQVADAEMRRRIFDNAIYRQITTTLTGSQEYAATLALHDFVASGKFDLVVLDTPPTANALDFLEAPGAHRGGGLQPGACSWFARPPEGARRFSLQRLRSGGALVLRRLAKFVGSRFLEDVGRLPGRFSGGAGRVPVARASRSSELLRGPDVGFLLVLVPEVRGGRRGAVLSRRGCTRRGIPLGGFVANRVHAGARASTTPAAIAAALRTAPGVAALPAATLDDAAARLAPVARGVRRARSCRSGASCARLAVSGRPASTITEVPLLDHDVDNLAELRVVGDHLRARRRLRRRLPAVEHRLERGRRQLGRAEEQPPPPRPAARRSLACDRGGRAREVRPPRRGRPRRSARRAAPSAPGRGAAVGKTSGAAA